MNLLLCAHAKIVVVHAYYHKKYTKAEKPRVQGVNPCPTHLTVGKDFVVHSLQFLVESPI